MRTRTSCRCGDGGGDRGGQSLQQRLIDAAAAAAAAAAAVVAGCNEMSEIRSLGSHEKDDFCRSRCCDLAAAFVVSTRRIQSHRDDDGKRRIRRGT